VVSELGSVRSGTKHLAVRGRGHKLFQNPETDPCRRQWLSNQRSTPLFTLFPVGASGYVSTRHCPPQGSSLETFATVTSIEPPSRQQQSMGNTPSRYPRSIKTAGGQRVPQKFIDEVLNHLADDMTALRSCSLVAKSWINLSRRHLFNSVFFTANDIAKWNETFPNPGEGPARHVRDLSFCFIQPDATIVFADRMSYFFNVQKLTLIGQVATRPDFISALGQLPPSTRSVDITFSKFLTAHVISVMKQLPNLDSLSLMSMELDGPIPAGAGNLIRGRLRGKLRLRRRFVNHDLLNTLAEVPTRPQFTEVEIRDARMDCFPATINLVGACQDTLTKLHFSALVQGSSPFPLVCEI